MNADTFSVSEIGKFIKDVLRSGFPRAVWVCGEIQELKEKNHHLYFTLAEKNELSHEVVAKIGVSIWSNTRIKIEGVLNQSQNAFVLKDDIQVRLLVKPDFYPPFGQIRLIVEGIDPVYTLGKIAQDRQRLIAALKDKGILERNKRLDMPLLPLRIGLITSYDSAAYHDFTDELRRSGYSFSVHVLDSLMQGKGAQESVSKALVKCNALDVDAIVITRGGGALAELACFDSEMIATAIAQSRLPVISGIGHEINTTITDLAAHTSAKTPTAVAQWLVGRVKTVLDLCSKKEEDLFSSANRYVIRKQQMFSKMLNAFKRAPVAVVKLSKERIKTIQKGLVGRTQESLARQKKDVNQKSEGFRKVLPLKIKASRGRLKPYPEALKKTIHLRLQRAQDKIKNCEKLVEMADPINVLKRGFSITRSQNGTVIKNVSQARKSKVLMTSFADGIIESEVV